MSAYFNPSLRFNSSLHPLSGSLTPPPEYPPKRIPQHIEETVNKAIESNLYAPYVEDMICISEVYETTLFLYFLAIASDSGYNEEEKKRLFINAIEEESRNLQSIITPFLFSQFTPTALATILPYCLELYFDETCDALSVFSHDNFSILIENFIKTGRTSEEVKRIQAALDKTFPGKIATISDIISHCKTAHPQTAPHFQRLLLQRLNGGFNHIENRNESIEDFRMASRYLMGLSEEAVAGLNSPKRGFKIDLDQVKNLNLFVEEVAVQESENYDCSHWPTIPFSGEEKTQFLDFLYRSFSLEDRKTMRFILPFTVNFSKEDWSYLNKRDENSKSKFYVFTAEAIEFVTEKLAFTKSSLPPDRSDFFRHASLAFKPAIEDDSEHQFDDFIERVGLYLFMEGPRKHFLDFEANLAAQFIIHINSESYKKAIKAILTENSNRLEELLPVFAIAITFKRRGECITLKNLLPKPDNETDRKAFMIFDSLKKE